MASPALITTERLVLRPLRVEDADEMFRVLDDPELHRFTGGRPLSLQATRDRFTAWVADSGNDDEEWLNWIVRLASGVAIGTVQATIITAGATRTAHVAWTIARPWQGQGYAVEAAASLAGWLAANDVDAIVAHVHPDHAASAAVARSIGLEPTDAMVDGEVVWR